MGRGSQDKASSAEGLLYGNRRRGSGPRTLNNLSDLIAEFNNQQIVDDLLDQQSPLMIKRPAEAVTFVGQEATRLSLVGFHRPFIDAEVQLTLTAGKTNAIALNWLAGSGATAAEASLLRGLASYLKPTPATVFLYPQSQQQVADYLNSYFPDGSNHPLDLVVDPDDRRPNPASELDYLAAESVEVEYLSDLVAASDLTDFMRYSRQPLLTLQQAFAVRPFVFTLPLARFNDF